MLQMVFHEAIKIRDTFRGDPFRAVASLELLASLLCILAFQPRQATTTGARISVTASGDKSINWLHPGQTFFYQVLHVLGPSGVKRADEAREHDFLHCMAPS